MSLGYVRWRIDRFLHPTVGDSFQTDRALHSFIEGGFFGKGPGEGTIKTVLPDAHTDFIFAVIAEEYGVLACLVLLALFVLVAVRVFSRHVDQSGGFAPLASAGLTLLFVAAGDHQHGGQRRARPGQGHDAALHLQRRLLHACGRLDNGHAAGRDPAPARSGARQKAGIRVQACNLRRQSGMGAAVAARSVMLAAGGTGGHLFPAFALAQELGRRAIPVDLVTDMRGDRYGADFPARAVYRVPSATLAQRSLLGAARTSWMLLRGIAAAFKLLGEVRPAAVVGFGGYPAFPPLVAARLRRIPTAVHEQNAVLGRANRMLATRVDAIATSFEPTKHLEGPALGPRASHRQPGARPGDRLVGAGLSGAHPRGAVLAAGVRRQPGRALLLRHAPPGAGAAAG